MPDMGQTLYAEGLPWRRILEALNRGLPMPSYHPSQQNTQTGRLSRSMFHQVFATARTLLDKAQGGEAGGYR